MERHCYFVKGDMIIVGDESSPDFILNHPESFGFKTEYLESIYNNYGEQFKTEGIAIQEILLNLDFPNELSRC
jgi:hypothetical protein